MYTQPTDESGSPVGHVLHVATGMPQLMVVTVDNCTGSQAYVGLASTYYEDVTSNFERLTDEQWSDLLAGSPPPARPTWLPAAFNTLKRAAKTRRNAGIERYSRVIPGVTSSNKNDAVF